VDHGSDFSNFTGTLSSCKLKGSLYSSLLYKDGANKTLKINAFQLYPLPVVPKGVA
jgi:hypothetical protein